MHVSRWMTLGVAAIALTACGQKTETTTTTTANGSSTTVVNETTSVTTEPTLSPGQAFANTAAASDSFEISASTLALAQGQSAAVKKFATDMVKAHTDSTNKLKAAAGAASPAITPDATLTAEQQQTLDSLKGLHGADFDKAFAAAQVDAHQATLNGLKDYSANGDVAQLKDFATKLIPTVTAHLNMAKALK